MPKKITLSAVLFVLLLVFVTGCATTPPQVIRDPFSNTVQNTKPDYNDFKLTAKGDVFWGMTFVQGTSSNQYTIPQIAAITKASDETKKRYDSGTSYSVIGTLFGSIGGFSTGWVIGSSLTKPWNNTDTYFLGAGAVSFLISYLFSSIATGDYRAAVDSYNTRLQGM